MNSEYIRSREDIDSRAQPSQVAQKGSGNLAGLRHNPISEYTSRPPPSAQANGFAAGTLFMEMMSQKWITRNPKLPNAM